MRVHQLVAGILFLIGGSAAMAQDDQRSWAEIQEIFDRGCGDDQGTDRCDSEVQQRMRDLYRIASPSEMLDEGITMRRAMLVDGYGNEVAAITFARKPGESPKVEVRAPWPEGAPEPRPLTAAVSSETWAAALGRSENFDQQLVRELPRDDADGSRAPPRSICLHAWFVVVEAADAPRVNPNILAGTGSGATERDPSLPVDAPMEPGRLRADAESACADGLAMEYAFALADLAYAALPECSTLEIEDFRNQAMLLGQCFRLAGDRLVAGEANALVHKLERALRLEQRKELEWLFVGFGEERAERFRAAIDGGSLYFFAPHGADADHAMVEGQLLYFDEEAEERTEIADLKLNLLRQTGEFVIDTFEVTNRRPFRVTPPTR